jgi:hypothetical protein
MIDTAATLVLGGSSPDFVDTGFIESAVQTSLAARSSMMSAV